MTPHRRIPPAASRRRSAVLAMAIVAAAWSRAGAQSLLPAAPRASDVARLPSDSGAILTPGTPASLLALGPGGTWTTVLVGTRGMMTPAGASDSVARRVASCLATLGSSAVVPPAPWAAFDSATAGRAAIVVQIASSAGAPAACREANDPLVTAAGYAFVTAGSGGSANGDLLDASLDDERHALRPVATGRVQAVVFGGPAVHEARFYLAPDALVPDEYGRLPNVAIHLVRSDGRREIAIPDSVMRRVWQALAPWRVARLSAIASTSRPPALGAPVDTVLERAASLWESGDWRRAATVAAERRAERPLARRDALFASLLVGSALLAGGDSAGARAEYGDANRLAPCVRVQGAPAFQRTLARVEADSRCAPTSTRRLLAMGLVAPGGAQWARGDRFGAGVVASATLALAATAADLLQRAGQQHDAYTSATAPPNVDPLLDRANATRASARRYAVGAAAVWASSAVIGILVERLRPPRPDGTGGLR